MSNVIIEKSKIDNLANAIAAKSGESAPLTLTEMVSAVDGIETGGGITPTGNINIDQAGVTNVTNYETATVPEADFAVLLSRFYTSVGNVPKFCVSAGAGVETGDGYGSPGYIEDGTWKQEKAYYDIVPQNTSVTPTESAQTIGGPDYMMRGAVTVRAISSTYVGSGVTRRSSTDLSASGATVTAPAGYYENAATKSVASGTAGTPTATKGTVSNHSISVTPSVTNTTGYITGSTKTGTAVSVSASELVSGTLSPSNYGTFDVTNYASVQIAGGSAGTPTATKGAVSNHSVSVTPSVTNVSGWITGSTKTGTAVTVSASELASGSQTITENGTVNVVGLEEVVVSVSGGSTGMTVATATKTLSTAASSIQFTNLSGQPTSFAVTSSADLSTGGTKAVAVVYDGTSLHGMDLTTQAAADTGYTQSYSGGTLTITASSASFQANAYKLVYTYGGTSANLGMEDVQVGSGATSITFTGLTAEPDYFSCIFKSDFSTSSGYQRVMDVVYDGNSIYGNALDSSAHALTSWTYSYSNGSLTITSTGTNNGGYFHQPGYYQLTYGIGGTVEPTEIEVEPLSVTTNGTYTAPTGKAYSPVTVNVSGGGGVNVAVVTWSNTSTSTVSHTFSNLNGTPKAAFLRCTAQLTRSSSNTYYYIADICWDGTNAYGNYHLRSNGSYNNVAADAAAGFNVSVSGSSITFSSDASSRSAAPGSFYNGAYELTYVY